MMSAPPLRFLCDRCGRLQIGSCVCGLCGAYIAPSSYPLLPSQVAELGLTPGAARQAVVDVDFDAPPCPRPSRCPVTPASPAIAEAASSSSSSSVASQASPSIDQALQAARACALHAFPLTPAPAPAPRPERSRVVHCNEVAPERVERTRCEWGDVDRMFGGGVPRERAILVGGDRGTGKTTWTLGVTSRMGRVLVVSTEGQSVGEIRAMVESTGGNPENVIVFALDVGELVTLDQVAAVALELEDLRAVVIDSVQGLAHESGGNAHARDQRTIELSTELALALDVAVFLISQRAKDGSNLGTQKLEQLCSTVIELVATIDGAIEVKPAGKNRGGPVKIPAVFRFDESGRLVPWTRAS